MSSGSNSIDLINWNSTKSMRFIYFMWIEIDCLSFLIIKCAFLFFLSWKSFLRWMFHHWVNIQYLILISRAERKAHNHCHFVLISNFSVYWFHCYLIQIHIKMQIKLYIDTKPTRYMIFHQGHVETIRNFLFHLNLSKSTSIKSVKCECYWCVQVEYQY